MIFSPVLTIEGANPLMPRNLLLKGDVAGHEFHGNQYTMAGNHDVERVKKPAIQVQGRVFEGWDHLDALDNAAAEMKLPYDEVFGGNLVTDGFTTTTG